MAQAFNITPDLTANVSAAILGTKLEGNLDVAFALVEYGHLAAKAYGHLKKSAEALRKAFESADDMCSRRGQALIRNLVFQGFPEADREAYSRFLPPKGKEDKEAGRDDGYDAARNAKIRVTRTLSRHVITITDYCFPPIKAVTGVKRARKEKEEAAEGK
jgi:hypothetical protein